MVFVLFSLESASTSAFEVQLGPVKEHYSLVISEFQNCHSGGTPTLPRWNSSHHRGCLSSNAGPSASMEHSTDVLKGQAALRPAKARGGWYQLGLSGPKDPSHSMGVMLSGLSGSGHGSKPLPLKKRFIRMVKMMTTHFKKEQLLGT